MKRIIRLLMILGLVSVAVYVFASVMRRRQASPVPQRWTPPTVEPPSPPPPPAGFETAEEAAELAEDIAQAESEGMAPPQDFPATDVAMDAAGDVVQPAPAHVAAAEPAHEDVVASEDEGMTLGAEEAPVDLVFTSTGAPLAAEPSSGGEAPAGDDALDFAEMLEAAEHGRDLLEQPPGVASAAGTPAATAEADVVAEAFEELAATLVEETEVVAAPAALAETPGPIIEAPAAPEEQLFDSVEEALTDLEPAPIVPPPRRTAESYLDEGNVYFNVGQYGLAIERYTQAIEMDRDLTAAYYNRANARTRSGDLDNALLDYDRALELQPNDADALNNRGMLHLYRANYAAALRDFNGALAADPMDSTVMVNRGLAHLHGGDPAAGLVDFREAIRLDATDAAAQYGAAQASATLGNRDEALRHVGRALEIDPAYAREAAADPKLAMLQGDEEFLKLLRQSGSARE